MSTKNANKISCLPGVIKHKAGIQMDDPGIIPASGHDIGNYFARYGMSNNQIQAVMKLDGRLDFSKLSKAVKHTVDEELVLGCRLVESNPPYWKRINNLDERMLSSFEISDNPDEASMRFLASDLDIDKDAMVKVKLIRSPGYDTLCVKISHACADGAGAKEYLQLLSKIYTHVDREESEYIPEPRSGGRKDQDRLLHNLFDMALKQESFVSSTDPLATSPQSVWAFPWKQRGSDTIRFSMVRLPPGQLDVMSPYGKARGATINDLVLAATYRAMFSLTSPPYGVPMDISITMDLRRYLPDQKAGTIRNLTGGFFTKLARVKDETFDGTLSRVVNMTKRIKEGNPGLQCILGAEFMEQVLSKGITPGFQLAKLASQFMSMFPIYYFNKGFAGVSNVGFVSETPLKFGENSVIDAYIVPPVVRGPGYVMVVCSYNGIMTLMIGYYKGSIHHKVVDEFLEKIKLELITDCK